MIPDLKIWTVMKIELTHIFCLECLTSIPEQGALLYVSSSPAHRWTSKSLLNSSTTHYCTQGPASIHLQHYSLLFYSSQLIINRSKHLIENWTTYNNFLWAGCAKLHNFRTRDFRKAACSMLVFVSVRTSGLQNVRTADVGTSGRPDFWRCGRADVRTSTRLIFVLSYP